jgi:hypothetical protein
MTGGEEYIITCWHCAAPFNAYEASFCKHFDPTIICPFCLKCSCDAPAEYKKNFVKNSPGKLLEEKLQLEDGRDLKLGEKLIKAGKITGNQLKEAIENQELLNKRLGEVIVMMGLATEKELRIFLVDQKEIDEIDLEKTQIDFSLVKRVGIASCLKYKMIPLEYLKSDKEKILRIAISSKQDLQRLKSKWAKQLMNIRLIPYLANKEKINALLKEFVDDDGLDLDR